MVTVSTKEAINRTFNIKVNEFVFTVRLAEEVFVDHLCKASKVTNFSSKMGFSSDESEFVEDTLMADPYGVDGGHFRQDTVERQNMFFFFSNSPLVCQGGLLLLWQIPVSVSSLGRQMEALVRTRKHLILLRRLCMLAGFVELRWGRMEVVWVRQMVESVLDWAR